MRKVSAWIATGVAAAAASVSSCLTPAGSAWSGPPYMPSGDMPVRVVDVDGRPIAGAQVTGSVDINFGPLPSTCCNAVTLGEDVTDRNGVAVLRRPAFTFHPAAIYVRAPGSSEVTTFQFTPSIFVPVVPDAGARFPLARTVLDAEGRIPIVVKATTDGAPPASR